jgi:hypothetical protein
LERAGGNGKEKDKQNKPTLHASLHLQFGMMSRARRGPILFRITRP